MSTNKKFTKVNYNKREGLFKTITKLLFNTLKEDTLETTISSADYQDSPRKKEETQLRLDLLTAKYLL